MYYSSLIYVFLSCTLTVLAHTHIRNVVLDGKALDRGQCLYPYISNSLFNSPATSFKGQELYCRTKSMTAKVDACSIAAGDTIVLDFKESEGASGRAIENEHFGPITAYMAPAASQGDGAVWFKVFEQGFDASTDMWAINILNENDGLVEVTIPADIKAGDYILRGEVLALHQADKGIYELYPNCVLLTVTGGGSAEPEGVDLEVIYNDPDTYPGLLWNPFNGKNAGYTIPGPAVYEAGTVEPANIKANIQLSSSSASTTEEEEEDNGPTENNSNTKSNTSKEPCINGKRRVKRRRR